MTNDDRQRGLLNEWDCLCVRGLRGPICVQCLGIRDRMGLESPDDDLVFLTIETNLVAIASAPADHPDWGLLDYRIRKVGFLPWLISRRVRVVSDQDMTESLAAAGVDQRDIERIVLHWINIGPVRDWCEKAGMPPCPPWSASDIVARLSRLMRDGQACRSFLRSRWAA